MTQVPDLARLVRETSWIRALARSVVADAHLAEDLAQDTVAAALTAARAQRGPVRSWRAYLAASLRRRLFEHRREGAARAQREHRSARPEALPSTLAMVERAGLQRDLVQAVLELEDPYRSAILWRFFEELGVATTGASGPSRRALEYAFPDGGTRDQFTVGTSTVTDAEGRFEFARVARAGVELFASGDAILFAAVQLTPATDPDDVRIRAERRVHLQVELAPPHGRADALHVLDEGGGRLLLRVMRGTTSETSSRALLTDGRSHVLSLSQRARWVVLLRGEAEVARLAFTPAPAGVNLVRW
jgi:DNA-directed RNA polymerase specialized sigma24 family protein